MNDKAMPEVSLASPVSPAVRQKADRLVRAEQAGWLKTLGVNVIVMVRGDSGTVYLVSLWWREDMLWASCPCGSYTLCSHAIAAASVAYDQCLEVLGGKQ